MSIKSPKKLSTILGTYFTVSVVILTGAVLFFTYNLSIETINPEIEKFFNQQHSIAENIFEQEADRLENALLNVQNNQKLLNQLSTTQNLDAQTILQQFIDKTERYKMDVLLFSTPDKPVWLDASSPFPDVKPILMDIATRSRELLQTAKVLQFKNKTTDMVGIFKSKKIVLEDGRVMGVLIAGTVCNNNPFLLDRIRHKTRSLAVALMSGRNSIGASIVDGLTIDKNTLNSIALENKAAQEGFYHNTPKGQLISNLYTLNLYGAKTPIQIFFSIDDTVLRKIKQAYLKTIILISIIFVAFLFFYSFIAIKKLLYPSIERILEFTKKIIQAENNPVSIEPGTISELNTIGSAMESMVSAINTANTKLLASEAKYRRLAENSPDIIYRMSLPDGIYEYVSPASETIFGYPPDVWYDNPILIRDIIHPDFHGYFKEKWDLLLKGEMAPTYEYQILYKGESTRWIHQRNVDVRDKTGKLIAIEGIVTDISQRKKSEKALQDAHERFFTILNSIDATVYAVDMETHEILFMNQYMIESFGRDMTGEICWEAYRGESEECAHCPIDKLIDENGNPKDVYTWQTKNPITQKWYINYDRAIEWTDGRMVKIQIATDITELKSMEEELRQAHKMESIGTISGGIAHDFNNILGIIIGNTELAMDDVPEWNPARHNLEEIKTASMRAREIVKQLLSFSRKTEQAKKIIRILPIIKESIKLIRASIPTTIEIQLEVDDTKGVIEADPTQIHQILINMCTNAAHAMDENGGIMTIRLSEIVLDDLSRHQFQGVESGACIQLTIADTGIGIDNSIAGNIFDPYFTTKEIGKGSGMGLAVVHGIVNNHKGAITVYSEPGQGTTFKILFPSVGKEPIQEDKSADISPTGNEKILIVDDEEALAEMGAAMLERLGYNVATEVNPVQALNLIKDDPSRFDLIITDMTMPHLTGDQFSKKVIEMNPELPIILCTGFSHKINRETALGVGICQYLEKPLTKTKLAKVVREVLSRPKKMDS